MTLQNDKPMDRATVLQRLVNYKDAWGIEQAKVIMAAMGCTTFKEIPESRYAELSEMLHKFNADQARMKGIPVPNLDVAVFAQAQLEGYVAPAVAPENKVVGTADVVAALDAVNAAFGLDVARNMINDAVGHPRGSDVDLSRVSASRYPKIIELCTEKMKDAPTFNTPASATGKSEQAITLSDIVDHCAYMHRKHGPVWIVGRHPHDGAAIITYRHDAETDEEAYELAVSEDFLHPMEGDEWKPTHGRALEHFNAMAELDALKIAIHDVQETADGTMKGMQVRLDRAETSLKAHGFVDNGAEQWTPPPVNSLLSAGKSEQAITLPQTVIADLIEIARKAHALTFADLSTTLDNGSSFDSVSHKREFTDLADALASLEALPQPEGQTLTGPARAEKYFASLRGKPLPAMPNFFAEEPGFDAQAKVEQPAVPDWMRVRVINDLKDRLTLPDGDEARVGAYETLVDLIEIDLRGDLDKLASVDKAYLEQLQNTVADLACDGRRFRALLSMSDLNSERAEAAAQRLYELTEASGINIAEREPIPLDVYRKCVDQVIAEGLLVDETAPEKTINSALTAEQLRVDALSLAHVIADGHVDMHGKCYGCRAQLDPEDVVHEHADGCPVPLAQQMIENHEEPQ